MKRGMLPFRPEAVSLKFSNYLNDAALPTVPAVFGHVDWTPHGGWGMLGNDEYGDCVLAGAAHETMVWKFATERFAWFGRDTVVKQYLNLAGGKDEGLDPVKIAEWRRTIGLADSAGYRHRVAAYTLIRSLEELPLATYLFGAVGVCLGLPKSAENQFNAEHIWDDISGDAADGHYVCCVGRNSAGHLMFLTWGRLQAATDEWLRKYMAGGLAYLSQDYLLKSGVTPEAITWDQLAKDLAAL